MPLDGACQLPSKTDSDIQVSAELLPCVGFAARVAVSGNCNTWVAVDRLALWIDSLSRAPSSHQSDPPAIEFAVYSRVNTSHELIATATWTPSEWDAAGLLLQISNRLCACFEVYARVLDVSGNGPVRLRMHAILDRVGPPYDTWHGANVVIT
jgi:hypothetical protein